MLEQIFLKIMDMSGAASLVIVIVFLVRILLKRFPKYLSYMLWSVALFRLLCPVTLESRISPIPNLDPVFYEYLSEKDTALPEIKGALSESTVLYIGNETKSVLETTSISPTPSQQAGTPDNAEVPCRNFLFCLENMCGYQELVSCFCTVLYLLRSFVKKYRHQFHSKKIFI